MAERVVEARVRVGQRLVAERLRRQLVRGHVEVLAGGQREVEHAAVDPEVVIEVAQRVGGRGVEPGVVRARGVGAVEEPGGEIPHGGHCCPLSVLRRT